MNASDASDIAYVRAMADAARKAPLLSGRIYVFYGLLVPLAYVAQWAVLDGRFGLPPVSMAFIWGGFGVCAGIGMPILIGSLARKPGRGSAGNRIDTMVWTMISAGIIAFVVGVAVATLVLGKPPWLWDFIVAIAFAGYGVALYTTGVVSETKWMRLPAFVSIASAGVVPTLVGRPELYLFAASILLGVVLVPGILLMRAEPESVADEA
ncbi:MAG: hypothetical protein HRU11_01460 [Parvularculaceae bacterium]|nr:hypothetical protein [Parvularculaceae bacterium]